MFTIDQIKAAHAKVKSGADFPQYVQDMKALGVTGYAHYVADGHTLYTGNNGFELTAGPAYTALPVAAKGTAEKLQHAIHIHQQGQTDYPTFCRQAGEAGVEKWVNDFHQMTCTYLDQRGNVLVVEPIPAP
jgi:uncharacterized protein YbcV (DUF1398 family)